MRELSIEQAMNGARRFAEREWRLLLPIALAFEALPALLIQMAWPDNVRLSDLTANGSSQLPPWLATAMLASFLVTVFGALVMTALVLVPRVSVGEALRLAARRTPAWLGAGLVVMGGWVLAFLLLSIALGVLAAVARGLRIDMLLVGMAMGALVVMMARLSPLLPLLIDRPLGPVAAVKTAWALTAGRFWRLLAFLVLFLVGTQIVNLAMVSSIGSILLLIGKALGWQAAAAAVVGLFGALLGAVINTAFVLIVAAIYRQLTGASSAI